jgi:antitoxin component of RelBE/YafQ-DinJ toxin-antitoxin module
MGMNLTTTITIFVRQAVKQKKIPFEISRGAERHIFQSVVMENKLYRQEISK